MSKQDQQSDILPDMSDVMATMGRGSMQRRIEELERLLLEVEYTASVIDRLPLLRVQQIRSQIQLGRAAGWITQQPR